MIDVTDFYSLTTFQRNAREQVRRLARTGRPHVLTVNGRARLVVQDAASYQRLLDQVERAEALAGIRRGLKALERGKVRPLSAAVADLGKRREPGGG